MMTAAPHLRWGVPVAGIVMLGLPWIANDFFTFQILGQTLVLGLIALSLTLLAGYGGMASLSQMTVAGMAGYFLGLLGTSNGPVSLGITPLLAIAIAIVLATTFATFIGWLSSRTEGVYTIMITLAIGVATFYLVQQNRGLFNGFQGISGILPPQWGGIDWRAATPFYYLALLCAGTALVFVNRLERSSFGLALQAVRDNPRRASALGYDVVGHRIASHAIAGVMAAVGGVLLAWYNSFVSPGVIGVNSMINILIIAVIGGMNRPIGAFVGAFVFVLLQNFAIDLVGTDRFRMLIGAVFLAIVLFSPDGLLGLWERLTAKWRQMRSTQAPPSPSAVPASGPLGSR